jgi:hypothetical protein
VLDGVDYIAEKLHIVGQHLHAHQRAGLAVEVKPLIFAR